MENEKNVQLVNIYIKIHNKQALTMEDLAYLAKYNPECFKKTCDNLIYNMPETKNLVKPQGGMYGAGRGQSAPAAGVSGNIFQVTAEDRMRNEQVIQQFLSNLKKMETKEMDVVQSVDVEQVKDLMGNLYMEMMFPHSGMQGYFEMYDEDPTSTFNARA